MVGKRHYEVAKLLKEIPRGHHFTIRLVEPLKSGFNSIAPKTGIKSSKKGYGSGRETLRFKADGKAEIAEKAGISALFNTFLKSTYFAGRRDGNRHRENKRHSGEFYGH